MKILLIPYHYFPHQSAGGEHYLHALAKGLQSKGHEVKAIVYHDEGYNYDGIECYPMGRMETMFASNNEICQEADVIIMQLLGNAYGFNKAKQFNKKLIFIAHNTSNHYFCNHDTGIVYNSQTLANRNLYPNNKPFVLQPMVKKAEIVNGSKIALVNCNLNKGGALFIQLAKMLPQFEFVGIKGGYGDQITAELPNLTYRDNSNETDYSDVKITLVLSETESWSLVATESIMRGIPVVCSDLPGLRENLSFSGIFIPINNLNLYANTINALMTDQKVYKAQRELCLSRADELDYVPRLDEFDKWLKEFVSN